MKEPRKRNKTVGLRAETIAQIEALAEREQIPQNEVIARAISYYAARDEPNLIEQIAQLIQDHEMRAKNEITEMIKNYKSISKVDL